MICILKNNDSDNDIAEIVIIRYHCKRDNSSRLFVDFIGGLYEFKMQIIKKDEQILTLFPQKNQFLLEYLSSPISFLIDNFDFFYNCITTTTK